MQNIRIATRQSELALWQAHYIQRQLQYYHPQLEVELVPVTSKGDVVLDRALSKVGGKGLFIKALEEKLLSGEADIAVHSLKDVPADLDPQFKLLAFTDREHPGDALISRSGLTLDALPQGAVIGTSSPRRQAQLKYCRPDLQIKLLRGNINTRMAKLDSGEYDAIILAVAGLYRLGWHDRITEILSKEVMLPSMGQGIVAIEALSARSDLVELMQPLNDPASEHCALAERAFVEALDGTCHSPIGAFAQMHGEQIHLKGVVLTEDGQQRWQDEDHAPIAQARTLGQTLAKTLMAQGAKVGENQQG